jgi:hopanoid biosynthesis associated RND transporter like protein HpnN
VTLRYRMFRALARLDFERPYPVLAICLVLAIASILYTRARLEFRTGQDDLVSGQSRDTRNYKRYAAEFPDLDGLIVVVRADRDPARAEQFADALAARLNRDRADVTSVFYKVDTGALARNALLYMGRADLRQLAGRIRDYHAFIAGYAADPTLQNFLALTNAEASRAMTYELMSGLLGGKSPPATSAAAAPGKFDLAMLDAVLRGIAAPSRQRAASPWDQLTALDGASGVLRDGYLASDNGKYLLMYVAPGDGRRDGPDPVDVIEGDLDATRAQFPGLEAGMTGGSALAHAEEQSTAHDIALASAIAIIANVLLVVIPFGGIVEPAFALTALLIGVAWSFGFTTLTVGHLNLLSAVFTSILAGIGINFPIHMMARYDEARKLGRSSRESVELGVVNTGSGVVASASIMALAFLMPVFTDFRGIAELGLVSAAGLFLCLMSAILVFPALVAIRDRNRPPRVVRAAASPELASPRLRRMYSRPWLIIGGACAATILAIPLATRLRFDQNLLKLQADSTEAVRYEQKLLKDSGRSSWFAVAMAPTPAQAERMAQEFRKLAVVADAETIRTYIPRAQDEKRAILASIKPAIESLTVAPPARPSDPAALLREMNALRFKLASAGSSDPSGNAARTAGLLDHAIAAVRSNPGAVAAYESAMAESLARRLAQFKLALDPGAVTEASLPKVLRDRFIGKTGAYLVQVYPRGDIWEDAPLRRFVSALRTVDPDVTGPPVQTYAIATVMRRGYERAALLALAAVFVFVFADFRNLRDTAMATVPLVFGGAWLLEAMGALGWEFNLANLFAVPIIIGTAVDNGVNMLYRWREEGDRSELILTRSVGKSVTIASLTTIAGFAALIPATHRGISSLGWVLSLGVTLILAATLVVLPAMFEIAGAQTGGAEDAPEEPAQASQRRASGGRRSGMLAVVLMCLAATAAMMLSAPAARAESAQSRSAQMVTKAEALIREAGRTSPVNTDEIYRAIKILRNAAQIDPKNDAAYVDMGFCYGVLRDGPTAVEMYAKAVRINPSAANFLELADIYMRVGQSSDALMAANAGIAKNPHDARLWNAKGMALNDLVRIDEAEQAFKQALKLDPSFTVAQRNLQALEGKTTGRGSVAKH